MSPDPRPLPYIKRAQGRRMEGAAINDISTYITTLDVYVRSHYSRTVYVLPAHCLITTRDLTEKVRDLARGACIHLPRPLGRREISDETVETRSPSQFQVFILVDSVVDVSRL